MNEISHDRTEESFESKVRWFRGLSVSERLDIFCSITDMALALNPELPDRKYAEQAERRIQIISKA
jgi:hypothetical protein